jgi:hypothetical protein
MLDPPVSEPATFFRQSPAHAPARYWRRRQESHVAAPVGTACAHPLAVLTSYCPRVPFRATPPSHVHPRAAASCVPCRATLSRWTLPRPTPMLLRTRGSKQASPDRQGLQPGIASWSPNPRRPHLPHVRPVVIAAVYTVCCAPCRARPPLLSPGAMHLYKALRTSCPPPLPASSFAGKVVRRFPIFLTITATVDRVPHHSLWSILRSNRSTLVWCSSWTHRRHHPVPGAPPRRSCATAENLSR